MTNFRAWYLAMLALATSGTAVAQAASAASAPPPSARQDCRPRYPEAALQAGAEGVTKLAFHVNADGVVTQTDILKSSGPLHEHKLLDQAAAVALSRCRLDVRKLDKDEKGDPLPSVVTVNYTWRIE
jgi:TonB family protein